MDESPDSSPPRTGSSTRPRVLFVADHEQARGLTRLLDRADVDTHCVDSLSRIEADFGADSSTPPDVVLLDLESCGGGADEEVVLAVRRAFPLASIVVLAEHLDGERDARLLALGVPSLTKPVSPAALSDLALRLSQSAPNSTNFSSSTPRPGAGRLDALLRAYSAERGLSPQQRLILGLHLAGNNDKEIASSCSCSEATVYEHWRRMARKAGGLHKSCVIDDFHKFLDR